MIWPNVIKLIKTGKQKSTATVVVAMLIVVGAAAAALVVATVAVMHCRQISGRYSHPYTFISVSKCSLIIV